jgi:hypothetical protein
MLGFVGEHRENVDFHRAQYRLWHQALTDIIAPLNNEMATHRATGPAAPAEPWIDSPIRKVFGDNGTEMQFREASAKVSEMPLSDLRVKANNPVLAQASDWSVPVRAPRRRKAR